MRARVLDACSAAGIVVTTSDDGYYESGGVHLRVEWCRIRLDPAHYGHCRRQTFQWRQGEDEKKLTKTATTVAKAMKRKIVEVAEAMKRSKARATAEEQHAQASSEACKRAGVKRGNKSKVWIQPAEQIGYAKVLISEILPYDDAAELYVRLSKVMEKEK